MVRRRLALASLAWFALACPDSDPVDDVGVRDIGGADQGADMGAPADTGMGGIDQGPEDMGPEDMGPEDMGPEDMGPEDMGPEDMGPEDMGPEDMGGEDMGPPPCGDLPDPGTVVYVDAAAPSGGSGGSWAAAFDDLQDGLAAASAGQEVWVREGLYLPVTPSDPMNVTAAERNTAFELVEGVAVFGGFDGSELRECERDPLRSPTVLSGDLAGNDVDDDADGKSDQGFEENSVHVLLIQANDVVLDGFAVQGGHADGPEDARYGGAILTEGSGVVLRNLQISDSRATSPFGGGGCVAALGGALTLQNVSLSDCVTGATGGGLYATNFGVAPPTTLDMSEVEFVDNRSVGQGGGASTVGEVRTTGSQVRFEINEVTISGGGTGDGGGLSVDGGIARLGRVAFVQNQAGRVGGGLFVRTGRVFVSHAVFDRNDATADGGGIYNSSQVSGLTVQYAVFVGNTASRGGAIALRNAVVLSHATVYDNRAVARTANTGLGGAFHIIGATNPTFEEGPLYVYNSIVWGNTADTFRDGLDGRRAVFVRSVLQDSGGSPWDGAVGGQGRDGGGVLDADPLFVDPNQPAGSDGVYGTADDGLHLAANSPALDRAVLSDLADVDVDDERREDVADVADVDGDGQFDDPLELDGALQTRRTGPTVDMGAFERAMGATATPTVHYVDVGVSGGAEDGTTWANAFVDLSQGLAAARFGDQIWVAEGEYDSSSAPDASYILPPGVTVLGGFDGTETMASQRDPAAHETTLTGGTGTGRSAHVVVASGVGSDAVLDGFTIENGFDVRQGGAGDGGGIFVVAGTPQLQQLNVSNNEARNGGGLYAGFRSQLLIVDSVFEGNSGNLGGAVQLDESSARIVGSRFTNNDAGNGGGGILVRNRSRLVVTTSGFRANQATESISSPGPGGGGIGVTDFSRAIVNQCVFLQNEAALGGGMHAGGSSTIRGSGITFDSNEAAFGGAISSYDDSDVFVSDAIAVTNRLNTLRTNPTGSELYAEAFGAGGSRIRYMGGLIADDVDGDEVVACPNCSITVVDDTPVSDPGFSNPASPSGPDGIVPSADDGLVPAMGSPAVDSGDGTDRADLDEDGNTTEPIPDVGDADLDGDRMEAVPVDAAGRTRVVGPAIDPGAYERP